MKKWISNIGIVRLNFLVSVGFGICMGIAFPFYAKIFVTMKSLASEIIFTAGCIIAGIIVGLVAFLITKYTIVKTVESVSKDIRRFVLDDVGSETGNVSGDEIASLVGWFNLLVDKLAGMVGTAKSGMTVSRERTSSFASVTDTMVKSLQSITTCVAGLRDTQVAQGAKADTMENALQVLDDSIVIVITNVMEFFEQLDTLTNIVIVQSGAVDKVIANISRVLAEIGNSHIADLSKAEDRATLFTTGTSLMESAIGLADKSKQNTEQIKTHLAKIGDIAAKINLIAINASIEAAHAGNSGRGFRVIATEIRTLSELTNRLTSDIKGVTNEIARDTDTAVEEVGEARSAYHDILSSVSVMTSDLYNAAGSIKTVTDDVKTNYRTIGELLIGLKEKIESLKENSDYCHHALDEIKKIGEKAGEQIDCLEFDATDASSINLSVLEESANYEKTLSEVENQISKYKVRYERLGE